MLVIVNQLTKMIHYKPVMITIDAFVLAEVIINIVVRQQDLLNLIISDWGLVFISKFWLSLCYFRKIKRKLWMIFQS